MSGCQPLVGRSPASARGATSPGATLRARRFIGAFRPLEQRSRADRPPSRVTQSLSLRILDLRVRVENDDPSINKLLAANFEAMVETEAAPQVDLHYGIFESNGAFTIERKGHEPVQCSGPDGAMLSLEKCLTVDLQRKRTDLVFLHSAAIEWLGRAYLFAADSGSGKSTTTWGMLHHGCGYLSDELSPIDLGSRQVLPYPHALCLKAPPPKPYDVPDSTIRLTRTMHIPASSLPSPAIATPTPLGGVFLLSYRPDLDAPCIRTIGHAEAGARLYVTALNALAHRAQGLDAILGIVKQVPCHVVSTANLGETCKRILATIGPADQCSYLRC